MNTCRNPSARCCLAALLSIASTAQAADPVVANQCAIYAQRAVQQYQQMQSHPGCEQNLEPLAWNADYNYHYNGCMLLKGKLTDVAEQGRDRHLQACGASAAPGAEASPLAPEATSSGAASTTPVHATSTPSAIASQDVCEMHDKILGDVLSKETKKIPLRGTEATITNGILSYVDSNTHKHESYPVSLPAYAKDYMSCLHQTQGFPLGWPLIWVSVDGKEGKMFSLTSVQSVGGTTLSGQGARRLLLGH